MATAKPVLVIIGGCGELGWETVKAGTRSHDFQTVVATYYNSVPNAEQSNLNGLRWLRLDCSNHGSVRELLDDMSKGDAVVYCAVPKHGGASGKGGEYVRRGIVDDVVHAARVSTTRGARFVAISTDLVFDGKIEPGLRYTENDPVSPTNLYGAYKAEMEAELKNLPNLVIARTSLILTLGDRHDTVPHGKGIQFVADALAGRIPGQADAFTMFTDELRCMSFSDDLGAALVELATPFCNHTGLIHLVSDEVANRYELACRVAHYLGISESIGTRVIPGLSAESGMNRPLNCALSTELLRSVLKTCRIRGLSERFPSMTEVCSKNDGK